MKTLLTKSALAFNILLRLRGSLAMLALFSLPAVGLAQTDATLSALVSSTGPLTPAFSSGTTNYAVTVPYATNSMDVTATTTEASATITVNANSASSGVAYGPINLSEGVNTIDIVVTSGDLSTSITYSITVTRSAPSSNADLSNLVPSAGTLTPAFASGTLDYTATVFYPTTSMTVTPTAADAAATITVNGNPVASGVPSGSINLNVGTNAITTVVTAEDAVTTKTYTLAVTLNVTNPVALPGGPYFVFAGGTLVLNGNASLPSDGQTITSYEWDLNPTNNGGVFNADVTGATPAAINYTNLTGTYGMSLGGNTIKLRVTDSSAKTSVAVATVNLLPAVALVYEPFAYSGTLLNGVSGSTEVGLTGTWDATSATFSANLAFGPLVTRGTGIGNLPGGNNFGGARAVSASALAANGLLNNGATLWFSVIVGFDTGGNLTNTRLGFGLANSPFSTQNFNYNIVNEGSQLGSGLGLTLGRFSAVNGRVVATQFRDPSSGTGNPPGFSGNVFGTSTNPAVFTVGGQSGLIVGKITWGATTNDVDTIELYKPGVDLALPATPISTLSVIVDQATYDTITWARGDRIVMDEIRFGGSYQAVIETGSAWDLNGNLAGAGGPSPSGTWNTDAKWNLAPDGTLVPIPWQAGSVAVFSAGGDATNAYTVTVDGTKDIGGLVVEEGTVTINGGTALRMTRATTMSVAPGLTASISTPLTEDGFGRDFTKAGAGTLVLSGNNVAATNGMNLSAGVVRFESPAAINGTARNVAINSDGTLMFGSGFGAGNIPAALLGRVTDSSSGVIAADNYASTSFDFSTPGLTNAYLGAVGSVNYTGTLTPFGTTYRLAGGGGLTMANSNALTGANALVAKGNVTLAQNNDYTGTTTIIANSTVTILGATGSSGVSLNTPSTMLILGNSGSLGTGTLTVVNSFAGPGTLAAIGTVVTANPVTANTDFNFGGTGALTIGTVTVNGARTITNTNTTDVSTISSITSSAASPLTFSGSGNTTVAGAIGGGSGITTLTKNGTGTLTLSAANAYVGTTTAAGGVVRLNDALAIPGGIGASAGTSNLIFNGGVVGLGFDNFNRPLNAANTLGAVTFTGNGGWAAYGADRLVNLGGASAPVTWATANTGLNGKTLILGSSTATHTVDFQNPLDLGAAARTVQVDNGGAVVDATLSGVLSGIGGGLTKTGTGTLALTGASTNSGVTTVSAGTLLVNGSIGTNTVNVQTNATLGGTGTINGSVTVANGGNLAPGASPGLLTVSNLNLIGLAAGATGKLRYELGALAGLNDRIAVTGTLTIGTNLLGFSDFVFTNLGGLEVGTYTLIANAGGLNPGDDLDLANTNGTIGSFNASLRLNGANLELVVSSGSTAPSPTLLTNSVSGSTLTFTWPAGQNWRLVGQTNSRSSGLNPATNAWFTVPGGVDGSNSIAIDPANPTTFYRLVYP